MASLAPYFSTSHHFMGRSETWAGINGGRFAFEAALGVSANILSASSFSIRALMSKCHIVIAMSKSPNCIFNPIHRQMVHADRRGGTVARIRACLGKGGCCLWKLEATGSTQEKAVHVICVG
jgi:hypothetical protein